MFDHMKNYFTVPSVRACLVTEFALEGKKMEIVMELGMRMGMELDVFDCAFKGMVMSSHCNIW